MSVSRKINGVSLEQERLATAASMERLSSGAAGELGHCVFGPRMAEALLCRCLSKVTLPPASDEAGMCDGSMRIAWCGRCGMI